MIQWSITLLADKKWQIRSHTTGDSPHVKPEPEEGDEIPLQPAQHKPHSWVIKRCATTLDSYLSATGSASLLQCSDIFSCRIYSPSQPGLFWSFSDTKQEAAVCSTYVCFLYAQSWDSSRSAATIKAHQVGGNSEKWTRLKTKYGSLFCICVDWRNFHKGISSWWLTACCWSSQSLACREESSIDRDSPWMVYNDFCSRSTESLHLLKLLHV